MCSHVGASGLHGSGWNPRRTESGARAELDSDNELGLVAETLGLEGRTRSRHIDIGAAGRDINLAGVELLLRSALPGRKTHRKPHSVDYSESVGENTGDRDRERETVSVRGLSRRERERDREVHRNRERDRERNRVSDKDRERNKTVREGIRSRTQSLSNSSSTFLAYDMEDPEGTESRQSGAPSPRTPSISHKGNAITLHCCPPHLASGSASPALPRPSIRIRTTTMSPQRSVAEQRYDRSSCTNRERDAFWVQSWTRMGQPTQTQRTQSRLPSHSSSELGEEEEEEGVEGEEEEADGVEEGGEAGVSGVSQVVTQTLVPAVPSSLARGGEKRMSKREKNRLKSLRKRQRRRERWRQNQLQENMQSSTGNPSSSSEDEYMSPGDRDSYICAVCLDVYFSPYMCTPCHHIFCEPCLRTLAKNNPTNTPCPLCRTIITHVYFQKELNHTARAYFPKEYISRKQNFQKASCAKWPLPSCRKLFRIFGGFQRPASPIARRQFPHGGYRLDAMDFEDDSRGWRFDMDMVIIYIYSVNWVIGFFIFCFLCYFFFPSF
ncbi:zinc finger CCCH domain-containing protein 18 [Osmerus eperlanus]|uniref:zinc finger CCCH domain-containing protein 18 n=1 Tax=Osmerus eperlanus TaxID=29151 RepID=UPI002E1629D1